ncbi:MAG: glutaredoxin [Dermatophilaceae bacterium]
MNRAELTRAWGKQIPDPGGSGNPTQTVGIPVVVTLVEAPACHLCEDAKSALAVLARSYPLTVRVLSIGEEHGRELMQQHRAPMSPLVLLDGQYFSSGRLPRRKLEKRLAKAKGGEVDG